MAAATTVAPSPTRNRQIIKRYAVSGTPRGVAVAGGKVYVGLSETQSVAAIDLKTGALEKEVVLDSAEIAATKELISLRTNSAGTRLYVANGSDESATILSLPDLEVVREIGLEGEEVRDILPDPAGKYLYVLGREVHVYDADGSREIRTLHDVEPMAIATDRKGSLLIVVGSEEFESGPATVVVLYDTATLKELDRQPLQTDRKIKAALLAADDSALVVVASDWFAEKPIAIKPAKQMKGEGETMRIAIDFGDLVSSQKICLATGVGPQALALGPNPRVVVFPEKRCSAEGSFTASKRKVSAASLYGVNAFAVIYDRETSSVIATDPAGFLTIYKTPAAKLE